MKPISLKQLEARYRRALAAEGRAEAAHDANPSKRRLDAYARASERTNLALRARRSGEQVAMTHATESQIARAIAHHFRSRRSDGTMTIAEYAYGIVNGHDSHVRWQDTMLARERIAAGLDLGAIGHAVSAYRATTVRL